MERGEEVGARGGEAEMKRWKVVGALTVPSTQLLPLPHPRCNPVALPKREPMLYMAWGKGGMGGRTKPDVRWEVGRRRFVRNTEYCLFFKIKNSRKCDEGS